MGTVPSEDKSRNDEIKRLHREGLSYSKLAKKYNVSIQRIHQIVKNYKTGWHKVDGECYFCKSTKYVVTLHIDGDTKNNLKHNLVSICTPCQRKLKHIAPLMYENK